MILPSPGGGDLACSLRKARNSAGAISGWTLAGTQKRWKGSSAGLLGPSMPLMLLPWSELEPSSCELLDESPSDVCAPDQYVLVGETGDD